MEVTLLHHTPLGVCAKAIRTCYRSFDSTKSTDEELIYRVFRDYKHSSVVEHLVLSFSIKGISRAVLQELARHRLASLSVESTRYTLKKVSKLDDCLVLTGISEIDELNKERIKVLRELDIKNDMLKYAIPEAYKTNLIWTINCRSLDNFLSLRLSKSALWEIRELAKNILLALPDEYQFLFKELYDLHKV